MLPIMVTIIPLADDKQIVLPGLMFAVMLRLVLTEKPPPAAAGANATVDICKTFISWSIVTVKPLALTSSPAIGRVPPFQFAAVDQLPFAKGYFKAIFNRCFLFYFLYFK